MWCCLCSLFHPFIIISLPCVHPLNSSSLQIEHDRPEFKGDPMVSFIDGSPMTYYPPEVRCTLNSAAQVRLKPRVMRFAQGTGELASLRRCLLPAPATDTTHYRVVGVVVAGCMYVMFSSFCLGVDVYTSSVSDAVRRSELIARFQRRVVGANHVVRRGHTGGG